MRRGPRESVARGSADLPRRAMPTARGEGAPVRRMPRHATACPTRTTIAMATSTATRLAASGTNVCRTAFQKCQPAGDSARWSNCPNKGPRNCSLPAVDGDCNGTKDGDEPQCRCDGKAVGTGEPCPGACISNTRTCTANTSGGAQWVGCPTPPINCATPDKDANCNGTPDGQEKECLPCLDGNGPAGPAFTGNFDMTIGPSGLTLSVTISGCAGSNDFNGRGKSCGALRPGFTSCGVCTVGQWSAASQTYGSKILQDYWLNENLIDDASMAGCNLNTFSSATNKCLYGRVCSAANSSCETKSCSVAGGPVLDTLGCGDNSTPSLPPTAGTLCCCK